MKITFYNPGADEDYVVYKKQVIFFGKKMLSEGKEIARLFWLFNEFGSIDIVWTTDGINTFEEVVIE